ncbi:amidase family protein [Pacificimonas flava]|uniref:amidase family protein n=1 Tax=Pacificimonas flava TaxID=1234595 RepID=UPI00135F18DF|nr:amidase family protein [Pacificimonas flava]
MAANTILGECRLVPDFNRRRFLESAALLAAAAPLSGCLDTVRSTGTGHWRDAVSQASSVHDPADALELVNLAIYRLQEVNGQINAVTFTDFDSARRQAVALPNGRFAGVPTLIKDNLMVAGKPYTQGSRSLAEYVATQSDPFYTSAIGPMGLVPIGRSSLPEFGLTATTEPVLSGAARNPWNTGHSTGGSSGGSAAAVAAGVVAIAHANDGGGSIRIPASACGLVGLKPSRGRMAGDDDSDAATDLGVQGFLTRTVRDTAAAFHAAQGGPLYPAADLVTGASSQRLRIGGRLTRADGSLPDPEVVRVFEETMAILSRRGHRVSEADASFVPATMVGDFMTLWTLGAADRLQRARSLGEIPADGDLADYFEPLMLGMAERGAALTDADRDAAFGRLAAFSAAYREQFQTYDVQVTPVLGAPPAPIGYLSPRIPFEEQQARLTDYAGFTGAENVAGLPAISLPVGMSSDGLPIGLQFIGAPGAEPVLLALAFELENELNWAGRRPSVWVGDMELPE